MIPTITITPSQRSMVRIALGFDGRSKSTTYRNHFVIGPGDDGYEEWVDLVDKGLAKHKSGNELSGGDDVFWCTRDLAMFVREPDEHLGRDFRE